MRASWAGHRYRGRHGTRSRIGIRDARPRTMAPRSEPRGRSRRSRWTARVELAVEASAASRAGDLICGTRGEVLMPVAGPAREPLERWLAAPLDRRTPIGAGGQQAQSKVHCSCATRSAMFVRYTDLRRRNANSHIAVDGTCTPARRALSADTRDPATTSTSVGQAQRAGVRRNQELSPAEWQLKPRGRGPCGASSLRRRMYQLRRRMYQLPVATVALAPKQTASRPSALGSFHASSPIFLQ